MNFSAVNIMITEEEMKQHNTGCGMV